jgi:hypothetical protein
MEFLFDNILDKDEKIVKVFKPNKTKLYLSSSLQFGFVMFFVTLAFLIPLFVSIMHPVIGVLISLIITGGLIVLFIFLLKLYYNNLYFAYSNKRIIIRTGIFGVDYKSLDMGMIGAINVYISLIDKLLKKNTGSISFGSASSPMLSYGNASSNGYRFAHIEMPYELYREIKNIIDEYKAFKNVKTNNEEVK